MSKSVTTRVCRLAVVAVTVLAFAVPAAGQSLTLSASADFSTDDGHFGQEDIIHVQVVAAALDAAALERNELSFEPAGNGDGYETTLAHAGDGVYTASVGVADLGGRPGRWSVSVRLADATDEVRLSGSFVIRGGSDDSDDDAEDDDAEDEGGEDDDENADEYAVEGTVEEVGDGHVVVSGSRYELTATTKLQAFGPSRSPSVGDRVEVTYVTDGTTNTALRIKLKRGQGEDDEDESEEGEGEAEGEEVAVSGLITAVDSNWVTIAGVTFAVTDETELEGERGAAITLADVAVDLYGEAELRADSTLGYVARKLEVEVPNEGRDVTVVGYIQAADSASITVSGLVFALPEDVEVRRRNETLEASDLAVTMRVQVKAYDDGSTLTASRVKILEGVAAGRPFSGHFAGVVSAVADTAVAVDDVPFAVSERTTVRGGGNKALEVGDAVRVRYVKQAEEERLALQIAIVGPKQDGGDPEDPENPEGQDGAVEFQGTVDAVGADSLVVSGMAVGIAPATELVGEDSTAIALADIQVGDLVAVEARTTDEGLVATRVKVEEAVVVEAAVEFEEAGLIVVAGQAFAVTDETLIVDTDYEPLTLESVQPGAFVEVQAVASAAAGKSGSTVYLAQTITVKAASATSTTRTEDAPEPPSAFALHANYPNPFNPSTTIAFETYAAAPQMVTLTVYNLLGQEVRTLANATFPAGTYAFEWDGRDSSGRAVGSGVYLYRLRVGDAVTARTMTLLK